MRPPHLSTDRLARRAALLCSVVAALTTALVLALGGGETPTRAGAEDEGYVASRSCLSCHPDRHASWARTFHGRMTTDAGPATVLGDFDRDATVVFQGVEARMERRADDYTVTFRFADGQSRTERIVRTVGSRRMQQYLVRANGRYLRIPVAWHREQGRWIHLNGSFFEPDGSEPFRHLSTWDGNCVFCHNVKAMPNLDRATGRFATSVAELGISCGACHGAAGPHAARARSPFVRTAWRLRPLLDRAAVNPATLSRERSVMVCGHCHGQRVPEPESRIVSILERGDPFDAGEDLASFYRPVSPETKVGSVSFASRFWGDGSPRLTAYEYQGLLGSVCFVKGGAERPLTCLTCHSMHDGDPRGMIREENRSDAPCLGCHGAFAEPSALAKHTGHAAGSAGSRCYACHMPRVVYGVMAVHRTHLVRVPDPWLTAGKGVPNACSQCHVDRSLEWAVAASRRLWPARFASAPPLPAGFDVPEAPRALFAGDAVARAIAAEALGGGGGAAVDPAWARPFLVAAFESDDYPVVRYFAANGLAAGDRRLPKPDYLADGPARTSALAPWVVKAGIADPGLRKTRALATSLRRARRETDVEVGE